MYNVKQYQNKLKQLGYDIDIDGVYGPQTKSVVMNFQRDNYLKIDGIVGPKTWEKLFSINEKDTISNITDTPWIDEGLKVKGWHEVKNRAKLFAWLRQDGTSVGDPSKIPWCGDFVETAIKLALPLEEFAGRLKENPYWAQNWQYFGVQSEPMYGAILVFKRKGGGHVGFYVGEDKNYYHVLGGNQSNAVTVTRINKNRCIAVRYPATAKKTNKRVYLTTKGRVSTNEA